MTELEALKARHSIRRYADRPLGIKETEALRQEIAKLNEASGLHMQLVLNERKAFKSFLAYGLFSNVSNYVMVVGKKLESMEYRAGYYTECLVLKAQQLGLNTCIAASSYKKIAGAFDVGQYEKAYVCVAIGYGASEGRKHKIKSPEQVSNVSSSSPEWFADGVAAALLAPTAINQQKFYFEYIAPGKEGEQAGVRPKSGKSLIGLTRIDLGIAMRNFEIGAGKENFHWIDNPMEHH